MLVGTVSGGHAGGCVCLARPVARYIAGMLSQSKTRLRAAVLLIGTCCFAAACAGDAPSTDQNPVLKQAAPGLETPDVERTVVPGERFGPIQAATTEQDLVDAFGRGAVERAAIDIAEGETEPGTKLFGGTPDELDIVWIGDYACPKFVRSTHEHSNWRLANGIGVGTLLEDVEAANDTTFLMWGFEWDYGGYVESFETGRLTSLLLRFVVPFDWSDRVAQADLTRLSGNQQIPSNDPLLRKLNPPLSEIGMAWPSDSPCASRF